MIDNLITMKEIGDHRIKIYYDTDTECPVKNWDMAGKYLFEHLEHGRYWLSQSCNWEDWASTPRDFSMADILQRMAAEVVEQKAIIAYYKAGKVKDLRFIYNRHERQWELQTRPTWRGKDAEWIIEYEVEPCELKIHDYRMELLEPLDEDDLFALIEECAKDFVIKTWDSSGYSQGNYMRGIAYMSKERYDKYVGSNGKPWKEHAMELIDAEVKEIGMWAWGDVKGFVLEKKVPYTKRFHDEERANEECYDWEEVDSCWGYFMETEELIQEVISEHGLTEAA